MDGPQRFPRWSLPTVVIVLTTTVLAGAALLVPIGWLAGWLVCEGIVIWRTLPSYATMSRRSRLGYGLFVAVCPGLGLQGLVALWNR